MNNKKQLIIISGRSGAGKTAAMRALEDVGFFVVDNLPPQLLSDLLMLLCKTSTHAHKIAIVVDARETLFLSAFPAVWNDISLSVYDKELVFLDAHENTIIERYQETRRRHPLEDGSGIKPAIEEENRILDEIRSLATIVLSTDKLNPHELKNLIKEKLTKDKDAAAPLLKIISFGYKNGIPSELDYCFDVRFLPNPFYDPALKPKTGREKEVFEKVLSAPNAKKFLDKVIDMIDFAYEAFKKEGRSSLTIAIGCTGGQHRSVAIASALHDFFSDKLPKVKLEHRSLNTLK